MFKTREYKSGSRWALWRWTFVPSDFITRLHILKTPWFALVLHWIKRPDPEPWLHDHPISFLSIVLRGWYFEDRQKYREDGTGWRWSSGLRYWINRVRASEDDRHTIKACHPKTLTLCFMGPKTREWGYHTPEGWVYWKDYNDRKYKGKTQ
jgi:hypothetical protein